MRNSKMALLGTVCVFAFNGQILCAQQKAPSSPAQVHVVITDMALRTDSELPRLRQDEVKVKQGKTFLQVTQLIPAQGDDAPLQLMILIDDTLDPVIGGNLNDIKEFIKAQPPSTVIGIGYMSNAGVNIVQNFTADHELAVKAVRVPRFHHRHSSGANSSGRQYQSHGMRACARITGDRDILWRGPAQA